MNFFKKIKNLTGLVIILSLMISPVFYAHMARAEAPIVTQFKSEGIDLLTSTLPAISRLPGCQKALSLGITSLFSKSAEAGISEASKSIEKLIDKDDAATTKKNLEETKNYLTDSMNAVETSDKTAQKSIDDVLLANLRIKEAAQKQELNDNCLNPMGKIIAKKLLQQITLSTIKWIQTGNGGSTFFVQNQSKFFGDLAKNEILAFGGEISDPIQYPYGKAFLQNVALSYNQRFQDNARYSLNELIAETTPEYTAEGFKGDFSQGGWNAWDALTQVPANNPLGFQELASEELGRRLEGTSQSNAQDQRDAIMQANGFLGDEKCVDPATGRLNDISREESNAALKDNIDIREGEANAQREYDNWVAGGRQGIAPRRAQTDSILTADRRVCEKWIYVTPGKTIADFATQNINDNKNSLLTVSTLNDAIAAILDAALGKFSNELTTRGLAGLSTDENDYQTDYGSNNRSSTTSDFTQTQINSSKWLTQNSDFDIRTDLDQAMIDTQRIYSDKLVSTNKALDTLIKNIWQLDYCIPGPNPEWETTSRDAMESVLAGKTPDINENLISQVNSVVNGNVFGQAGQSVAQNNISNLLSGVSTFLSSIPVVPILGAVLSFFTAKDKYYENQKAMARYAGDVLKVWINDVAEPGSIQSGIEDMSDMADFFGSTFDSYKKIINDMYFTPSDDSDVYMPTVTNEARKKFEEVSAYQQMILDNGTTITSVKSVINKLQNLKDQIDTLNTQLDSGTIKNLDGNIATDQQEQYNNNLIPIKNSFARLSMSIYSGDDIDQVDSIYKQAVDENTYVHDDLLLGPYGCEKFLGNLWKNKPTIYSKYVRRQPYPFQIDHLYLPIDIPKPTFPGHPIKPIPNLMFSLGTGNPYETNNYLPWNTQNFERILNHVTPGTTPNNTGAEGFLYGSFYSNEIAGPWLDQQQLEFCPEFVTTLNTPPLNGFETKGEQLSHDNGFRLQWQGIANECGVVNRGFERSFRVY